MGMWDSEALWLKAKIFMDKTNTISRDDPEFGLRSALGLELLARAALSRIHPSLNADPKHETSLFYALGFPVVDQPRSIPAHSVSARLERFIPGFGRKPHGSLFDYMILQRNIDLHTGDIPFANTNISSWLPAFYTTCDLLTKSLGKTLADLFGEEVGGTAQKIVAAFATAQEKAVKDRISQHRKEFEAHPPDEQARLREAAKRRTRRLRIDAVARDCPACGARGVLRGEFVREYAPTYQDGELLVDFEYLASEFNCGACGLELKSVDEIGLAGVDLQFTAKTATSLHDNFQPEWDDEYENM